jgi:hypothetical protein
MMRPEYITAIERRLAWAQSLEPPSAPAQWQANFYGAPFDAYRYAVERGDREVRRRAERQRQVAPPFIQVVTLRRMEIARRRDPTGEAPDWQWQWSVIGHWRWQWYPSDGTHKRIFIESFVKGPPDKPFKNTIKLFAAKR